MCFCDNDEEYLDSGNTEALYVGHTGGVVTYGDRK
jgi:hypothetical protein